MTKPINIIKVYTTFRLYSIPVKKKSVNPINFTSKTFYSP